MFGMKIFFICEADGLQCHLVSRIIFVFYTYIIMAMRQKDFLTKFMKWFLKHFNVNVDACHKALKIYLIPSQTRESNASVFFKELDMLQFWAHFMVYLLKILCLVSDNIENNCLVDIYMCVKKRVPAGTRHWFNIVMYPRSYLHGGDFNIVYLLGSCVAAIWKLSTLEGFIYIIVWQSCLWNYSVHTEWKHFELKKSICHNSIWLIICFIDKTIFLYRYPIMVPAGTRHRFNIVSTFLFVGDFNIGCCVMAIWKLSRIHLHNIVRQSCLWLKKLFCWYMEWKHFELKKPICQNFLWLILCLIDKIIFLHLF